MAGVRLERLRKSFGSRTAVDIPELEIADGSFFSLLGPSGCGKTTTLRLVAGLALADAGRILIGGRDQAGVPPSQRNLGMVFQRHALFPHLSVRENVAFGLRERRAAPAEVARRVDEVLDLVALGEAADRMPHQLSGGQQQRVALARAVVYRPDVLLLDEPLSSLDVQLRIAMRAELKRLQQAIGITTIFVTHDQHEALALSDRIAVMREGTLEQVGSPREIYDEPDSAFVARFVGGTNVLTGIVPGVRVAVKPERIRVEPALTSPEPAAHAPSAMASPATFTATGTLESGAYLGSSHSYVVRVGDQQIEARVSDAVATSDRPPRPGDAVTVSFDLASAKRLER